MQAIKDADIDRLTHILKQHPELVQRSDKTRQKRTLLHYAASRGNIAAIDHLMSLGADIDVGDHTGITPLHCAAISGHSAAMVIMVRQYKANLDAINCHGRSAFNYASVNEHLDAMETIIRLGYDGINNGDDVVGYFIMMDKPSVVQHLLILGATPDAGDFCEYVDPEIAREVRHRVYFYPLLERLLEELI